MNRWNIKKKEEGARPADTNKGLAAIKLELRPKPRRNNNKSKSFLTKGGLVGRLRLTMKVVAHRAERHPERTVTASAKQLDQKLGEKRSTRR